ncbi:MAG TPA: hypothetical protein VG934_02205 [Candidatus Paceibacterota bacterium]|nr:hypothetical protein [Candidatus Paceibacterota bacterium]
MFWKSLVSVGFFILLLALVHAIPPYLAFVGLVLIVAGLYVRARDRDWTLFNQRLIDHRNQREVVFEVPVSISFSKEYRFSIPTRGRRRSRKPRELLQIP